MTVPIHIKIDWSLLTHRIKVVAHTNHLHVA
jgi:hypothetical protein